MGIVFRQTVKSTVVVFGGAILGALTLWLSTNNIGKQELGFARSLSNYAIAGSQVLLLGMQSTLPVFIQNYLDNARKRGALITLSFVVPILFCLFLLLPYFAFKSRFLTLFQAQDIVYVDRYFVWLPFLTFLVVIQTILEHFLISQQRVAVSFFTKEIVLRLCNIAIILLFGFGVIGFDWFIFSSVLIYLIPVLLYFMFASKTGKFTGSWNINVFDRDEQIELIKFTWYHFLINLSITLITYLDTILLGTLDKKGLASVAIYTNAMFFISFLQIPYKAMYNSSFSVINKAFRENDVETVENLFSRSSLNILIGTVLMAILILCSLGNAISLMPAGYDLIKPVFAILVVGTLVDMATGMNGLIISISSYYRFNLYSSLILGVFLIFLNWLLIPRLGIFGAALSNATALVVFNAAKSTIVWIKLKIKPFNSRSFLVLFAGLPALAAGYFFPYFFNHVRHIYVHAFLDTTLRSLVVITVYFVMLLILKPSSDLQEYLANVKKNKKLF